MKKINISEKRLLSRSEVAKIFQVSPSTITRWAQAGKLPVVKTLGGHRRYEAKAVMKLAQQLTERESTDMEKIQLETPAMYADHHVVEVRRLLLKLAGVETVNASSCFQAVEVTFDPDRIKADEIQAKLEEAGYLDERPVPTEMTSVTPQTNGQPKRFFRHTMAYEQTDQVISFGQDVSYAGRPLWPCPGLGVLHHPESGEVSHG